MTEDDLVTLDEMDCIIAHLETLLSKATAPQWTVGWDRGEALLVAVRDRGQFEKLNINVSGAKTDDVLLIVAAVNAVPDLIAEVRQLREENTRLTVNAKEAAYAPPEDRASD